MQWHYLLHITWWRPQFLENLPGLVMMTVLDQPARRLRAEPESYKQYETRHRCQTKVIFPAVGVISKESIHQRCSYLRWKSVLIKTIHIIKISNASKLALLLLLLLFWTLSSPPVRNFVESVRMDSVDSTIAVYLDETSPDRMWSSLGTMLPGSPWCPQD